MVTSKILCLFIIFVLCNEGVHGWHRRSITGGMNATNASVLLWTTSSSGAHNTARCEKPVDLGFVLDCSGSVSIQDFTKMKQFVKHLTSYFDVSSQYTRVSVMTYASSTNIAIYFSGKFRQRSDLEKAIDSIHYTGGGTATALALTTAYNDMFSQRYGARGSQTRKVLIVITDGWSDGNQESDPARKLKNAGIVIFSIGVGSANYAGLKAMASEPIDKHLFQLGNFSQLSLTLAESISGRTCNVSRFVVLCGNDSITAVFNRQDLPRKVGFDRLYLGDGQCRASYNSTHVYVKTRLHDCGTTYAENEQTMFFSNSLSERWSNTSTSGITRDYLFNIKLVCRYGRKRTVGGISFEPARQNTVGVLEGEGNFSLSLDFSKNSRYDDKYSTYDYPVFKHLRENIHIEYSLESTNPDLVVHAETCRATATNRPYDNPQYVFIANGCDQDNTIFHFGNGMSNVNRFSIQAFRFLTQHRFVYIHCDLVVCNRNVGDSLCARGARCSRRLRRDVSESPQDASHVYPLSLGPLMYSEEPDDGRSPDDSNSQVITVSLISVACFAILLVVALIYLLRRRRRTPAKPTTDCSNGIQNDAVAMEKVDAPIG